MLFIIPLALSAVSAIGGLFGGSGDSQADAMTKALNTQIDTEKKLYELQQDTRLWQMNEQSWQRTREKLALQMQRKQQIYDSRLRSKAARTQRKTQTQQIKDSAFQTDQNYLLQQQQLAQEAEQAGVAQQGVTAEAQGQVNQIPSARGMPTESMQDLANIEAMNLARQSVLTDATGVTNTIHSRLMQDQRHQRSLAQAQHAIQSGSLKAQQRIANLNRRATGLYERSVRKQVGFDTRATRKAMKANLAATKALDKNASEADRAEYEARVAQLEGQMPVSQNNTASKIFGAIGQLAPLAGGLIGSSGGGVSPSLRPQSSYGTRSLAISRAPGGTFGSTGTFNTGSATLGSGAGVSRVPGPRNTLYSGFPTVYSNAG